MLRKRIIPSLLIHKKGLYKTFNFKNPKYIGDPLNTIRIFNEKLVDEIIVIDIDATIQKKQPNFELISNLAEESRCPICYVGGVKNEQTIERIISLGVEKVGLSSILYQNKEIISKASKRVGSQSIVAVLDIEFRNNQFFLTSHNNTKKYQNNPFTFANELASLGVGEIVINSVYLDGTMKGFDINLLRKFSDSLNVPVTALGGASSLENIFHILNTTSISGAAAGSLFVFKGKFRAVLIQYPNKDIKNKMLY